MTDEEAVAAGVRAEQAMTVLDPAIAKVREAVMKAMIETSPQQADRVLALHRSAQSLDAIRTAIQGVIANGKVSAAALEAMN